ncbi:MULTISPECIES: LTA synthase family protein [Vibrio]|uniref:LTA synthase family protein n=1 Tax=Vibrio TaxID=662 RepID=UPI000E6A7467|nr:MULTISPECIES: alkaline phosphatase family protein [Vibrio]MBG8946033.1 sulfatase-like hydrolase/transferase [Vibrio cholerae]MCO7019835.1 sulfatase-like hydrolase/transferase [Vibrio paracholerae]NOE54083.1 sulfatase-like hydrolase/transferase [Vibrio cholerae]HDL8933276.1 sulfatase-like hydrolase/transferase [Vibrio cholerae]HDM0244637.1 sulfatase-like hydrolase/transferase [Vibrio cholerae]
MNYQSNLRQLCLLLTQFSFFSISLLLISRVIFFLHINNVLPQDGVTDDIWRAFWVGGRFDAKVTAIAYSPLLLSGLIAAAFSQLYLRWLKFALGYHSVIGCLYAIGCILNYYYYKTYGSHVDLFIFGLWEDDSKAVLVNIWRDYPIIRSLLLAVLVGAIAYVSSRWYLRSTLGQLNTRMYWHWSITSLVIVFSIVGTFLIARGSLDSHPLKRYHASVSQYKPLNMITPNVFMALDWATTDYKEQRRFDPVSQRVLTAQMEKMLGQPTPNYHVPTNPFLADNPPHVVVAMMESMGMNILVEDDPQTNDLLGSLRPYWGNGFLFERFMAGTSATIDSIVMTLFHSPVATISHSSVQNIALPSSAVLPYKRAGYEVTFLYGGNGMWRNLANYLPVQGFDRVYDENDIIEAFPEAAQYSGTWGVPDGYLFKYANKVLEEAKKPTLIFIMTVTNHSPYKVPDYYQPKPTAMSERLSSLIGYQGDQAKVLLNTFQYASDALGQFIGRVKASDKLKDNTVIAVTGDHRMRYSSTDEPTEYGLTFAVPFFLDVPQPILDHTPFSYDPQRIGSHRDLFPTLYHFSLSNQDYISLGGENLLAKDGVSNIGFNASRTISEKGAFSSSGSGLFYAWDEHNALLNQARPEKNPPQETDWGKEYSLLQDYYLRSQVLPMTP